MKYLSDSPTTNANRWADSLPGKIIMPTKLESILINSAVDILAAVCSAKPEIIIEWMTGKLWDKDEADVLVQSRPTKREADPAPQADGEVYFIEWVDANHVRLTKTQGG